MIKQASVSFIVPSFNSIQTIERCLKSIRRQSGWVSVKEVIVVDSSNDRSTREYLEKMTAHEKFKLIVCEKKTSPAQGRNLGARSATGKLLCFVDSDVTLAADWLKYVLEAHRNGCRIGCGSVGIPPEQVDLPLALAQWYLQFNESLPVGERRKVAMVPACDMFCERSLFESVGGFPDMRASEDVMLCLKAGQLTDVWFVPEAQSFHIFREILRSYLKNQIVLGKYILVYRREYYDRWYYRGLFALFFLPVFLVIKFFRITMRVALAGKEHLGKFVRSFPLFLLGLLYWARGFASGCFDKRGLYE